MARGKLTKIKSVLKKWQSFGKASAVRCSSGMGAADSDSESPRDCQLAVYYVGKSRRRYYISSEVAQHPVFQELVERSGDGETVDCEVVLFEHLLWMLQNADPQPDDLLDLYEC